MSNDDSRKKGLFDLKSLYKPEDLCAELAEYLFDHPRLGKVLQHPLVYGLPYFEQSNRQYNLQFRHKNQAINKAQDTRAWNTYVALHERAYRLDAVQAISCMLEDEEYWPLIGWVWTDSENIWQHFDIWYELWSSNSQGREGIIDAKNLAATRTGVMDADDLAAYKALPDGELTVYRGFSHDSGLEGLSWTLVKAKAQWFARRFALEGKRPQLAIGKVSKEYVLAHFTGRDEKEIVVLPENVKILDVVAVPKARKTEI